MIDRTTKLRWRRRVRRRRQQAEEFSQQAEEHLERHFFKRLGRLVGVRRFVISWMLLLILLTGIGIFQTYGLSTYYQKLSPIPGGTYNEGVVGTFTNANPLFANTDVDKTVSQLAFAGLFKYDQSNNLVGDLAQSYSIDAQGLNYTVTLKNNLKWQDGKPLTASDVAFTYDTIQNPDTQSNMFTSWQGVKVEAINPTTILFTLPNQLVSFPYSLTNGIIPQHILSSVPPAQLRSDNFDSVNPIGAGPFKWQTIQVQGTDVATRKTEIGLVANQYYNGGKPKIDKFVVNSFNDQSQMLASFNNGSINAMVGLNSLPSNLQNDSSVYSYNVPLTAEVMVFFKNSQPILSDEKVRQALIQAVNENSIIAGLGYPVIASKSPLLPFQAGYDPTILQYPTNVALANSLLTQDGWVIDNNGVRVKNGQPLKFQLYTQDSDEYNYVAKGLSQQWKSVGADVQVVSEQSSDLQSTIGNHTYDALLYGISIGVDPDVFVYWHSSQAAPNAIPGLNLSLYKSATADQSLEAGRTRVDPAIRAIKYKPFIQSWQSDAPAMALYQPRFLYVTRGQLFGFSPTMFNVGTDRFSNVQNWETREVKTTNKT